MIGLLQRVTQASVTVEGAIIGAIGRGLLVLVGVQAGDTAAQGERLLERLVTYRVFADDTGRMNRSLEEGYTAGLQHRRRSGTRARTLRRLGSIGGSPFARSRCYRTIRRRHAGSAGERRAGHLLAGSEACWLIFLPKCK